MGQTRQNFQPWKTTESSKQTTSKSTNLVTIIEQQQQQRCISLTTNQSFNQQRPIRRTSKYTYFPVLPIHTIFRRTTSKGCGICDTFVISERCFRNIFCSKK